MADPSSSQTRRNRMIAIAAGAITTVAIVLAFASGYLGEQWRWLRPAGELLLLAELVGLIVLERHQLFEPVHEKVSGIDQRTDRIDSKVDALLGRITGSDQVGILSGPPEVYRALTRVMREALERDHETPQILRSAALSGRGALGERWALETEEFQSAFSQFFLFPTSSGNARARQWSVRVLGVFGDGENFDRWWQNVAPMTHANPLNVEVKFVVDPPPRAQLSPQATTDRDVVVALDDESTVFHWGLHLKGRQYAALFAQWFDELWTTLPQTYFVYSRSGLDQQALDDFRQKLAEAESEARRSLARAKRSA
jgi:hypothetical protein